MHPTDDDVAPGWTVRPATDGDAPGLVALIEGVFDEYPGCVLDPDGLDADLFAWRSHLDAGGGTGWVVLDDDEVVRACVGVTPVTAALPGIGEAVQVVELKRLYVAAAARRRGLGRALVARVEDWAREHGAGAVVLWSDTRFTDAHRLYEQAGYARTGRGRDLHDPSNTHEHEFVRLLMSAPR